MPDYPENSSPAKAVKTEIVFEDAAERLETIVREMENARLPLETLIVRYEEGMKLVEFCNASLAKAEKRIEIIQKSAKNGLEITSFDESTDDNAETADPAASNERAIRKSKPSVVTGKEATDFENAEDEDDDELSLF